MRRFDDRTAFVTGAAHGIGRAIAERLLSEGANVVLADLEREAAEQTVQELTSGEPGRNAAAIGCDITDRESVEAAISQAVETFGALDVLVNNAGRGLGARVTADDDTWWQQLDLNLLGAIRCIRAAIPALLRSRHGGNVVSVGSVNGIAAFGDVAYSTAKAGLHNVIGNLTAEFGPQGLRFNVVAPGTIRTRVWDDRAEMLDELAKHMYPLRRVGEPRDIAAAVAFLASDDAAWISGIVLPVDGGALAGPIASHFLRSGDS